MSTDHYIFCEECGVYDVPGVAYDKTEDNIQALIAIAPYIQKISLLASEMNAHLRGTMPDNRTEIEVKFNYQYEPMQHDTIEFLQRHVGHTLRVMEEYEAIHYHCWKWQPSDDEDPVTREAEGLMEQLPQKQQRSVIRFIKRLAGKKEAKK